MTTSAPPRTRRYPIEAEAACLPLQTNAKSNRVITPDTRRDPFLLADTLQRAAAQRRYQSVQTGSERGGRVEGGGGGGLQKQAKRE